MDYSPLREVGGSLRLRECAFVQKERARQYNQFPEREPVHELFYFSLGKDCETLIFSIRFEYPGSS